MNQHNSDKRDDYNKTRLRKVLNPINTVNCREKTGTEVVIEIFISAHLVDLLPFGVRHLFFQKLG